MSTPNPTPLTLEDISQRILRVKEQLGFHEPTPDSLTCTRCIDLNDKLELLTLLAHRTKERDALQKRIDTNRCNSGHVTLPLTLWDCPECHNQTRRERDALRAQVQDLTNTLVGLTGSLPSAVPHKDSPGKEEEPTP